MKMTRGERKERWPIVIGASTRCMPTKERESQERGKLQWNRVARLGYLHLRTTTARHLKGTKVVPDSRENTP